MTTRVQALRSSTSGAVPAAGVRLPGEMFANFPDLQMGVIDGSKTPQKLIAVRFFSASANYAIGDFVVQAGSLYVANSAVTAGAFNASKWNKIVIAGDLSTLPYLPIAGGTLTGALTLAADPGVALGAATKQYVDTKVPIPSSTPPVMDGTAAIGVSALFARADHVHPSDTSRLALTGGTLTGSLNGTSAAFSGQVNTSTMVINSGLQNAFGSISICKQAGTTDQIATYTGTATAANLRWVLAMGDATAEGGANAGSNFNITRYSDSGAYLGQPMFISRASGSVSFQVPNSLSVQTLAGLVQPQILLADSGGVSRGLFFYQASGPYAAGVGINNVTAAGSPTAFLNASGQWQVATHYNTTANAYMAGGTLWSNTSDERIKNVVGEYTLGLDEVLQLRPIRYTFKGNDTWTERVDSEPFNIEGNYREPRAAKELSAPYPASHHHDYAKEGREFVGFIAQEVETILPGAVTQRKGYIDGQEVSDMRDLNLHELLFALVNSVKSLKAEIDELKGAQGKAG